MMENLKKKSDNPMDLLKGKLMVSSLQKKLLHKFDITKTTMKDE
jgi:hypothetical protein